MPINNINTLQNYEDLRYTTYLAYQDANGVLNTDYYIHALANLEQRNEYRYSNGIKYGILNYDTDVVITQESVFGNNTAEATMFLELPNDMGFDIYVNNIETYLKHSQIYNDGKVFKSLMFGKILGAPDTVESNNVEIQYTDIDLTDHTLNEAYRASYLNDETNSNIYILLHVKKLRKENVEFKYKLTIYKLVFNAVNADVKNLFRASTYAANNIGSVLENIEINVNNTDLFTQLIKNCSVYSTETIENNYTLDCVYDTIDEQLIKISDMSMLSDNYNKINELLYFNYFDINQYVRALNNDLVVTYPNLLKYYSNRQFNSNSETLKMMIAKSLFSKIYNDLEGTNFRNTAILTIPAGTTITYISNVENALQIYYTDDIYVYFINSSINNRGANAGIKGITFIYDGVDKTIIYDIYSKYNTKYTELIDGLLVYKKYVLPYIDDSHLWNINDNQTTVYASGESAGNPNIFIVQTYYDDITDSIQGRQLNRNDIQQNMLSYRTYTLPIKYTNNGTSQSKEYKYVFAVPVINKKSIDKLKYATLFVISNITELNVGYNTKSQPITTVWTIKDNAVTNELGFEPIILNNQYLTFDDMFGLDSAIYRKFAEYGHISNVFDDLIALKLPRTALNGSEPINSNNYFVIERNTSLDDINSDYYPEHAYNYNVVEMKVNDYLNNPDFSYATESFFNSQRKFLNMWHDNGDETKQIYCTGTINVYKKNQEQENQYSASTGDIEGDEVLSQYAQGPNNSDSEADTTLTTVITGTFDKETIEKYYDPQYNDSIITNLEEYLPKSYVPILKESNIFHQDSNIINRTNIYTFTNNSSMYYAYVGSSCEDKNKDTIHIGTSDFTYMVNLGKESLISSSIEENKNIFKQAQTLSVDLSYTYINSNKTSIKSLETENDVRINEYDNDGSIVDVITLELPHIHNKIDEYNSLIHTIYDDSNSWGILSPPENVDMIKFKSIALATTIGVEQQSRIVYYLKNKYPLLFENGYLNENIKVKSLSITDDSMNIDIKGTYVVQHNLLLFDSPLILHIVKCGDEMNIYI